MRRAPSRAVRSLPDTALLTALAIPPATQQKVLDRLGQGDITWNDDAVGLVVHVPPSGSTRARARTTPRPYRVTADSCTCRGFFVHGGCYHPWLWAVIDAQLHPPVLEVTGTTQLTLERALVVAALELLRSQAVGEIVLWFVGNALRASPALLRGLLKALATVLVLACLARPTVTRRLKAGEMGWLLSLVADGRLDPQIDRVASWREMGTLLEALGERRVNGKAVALID